MNENKMNENPPLRGTENPSQTQSEFENAQYIPVTGAPTHFHDNGAAVMQPVAPAYGAYSVSNSPQRGPAEPFEANRTDSVFAVIVFLLGFLFAQWVLFSWQGWGVTVFTFGFCGAVTYFLIKNRVRIARTGWFYLSIVLLIGSSFALYTGNSLEPLRSFLLLCLAVYWIMNATGTLLLGKTSNFLMLDGINGMFVIPFSNFGCQYKSLAALRGKKEKTRSALWPVAFGLLLAVIVGCVVLPLLMEADNGGFSKITAGVLDYIRGLRSDVWEFFIHCLFAIPIAAYLFGLIAGCTHKRNCTVLTKDGAQKTVSALRILPTATVTTLLSLVCGLYIVFIGSQLPYFFSAFAGVRPEGWQVYSEYARRGFFELCSIAAINLALLTGANLLCKKPRKDSAALKVFNCLLVLLTLVFIATAFSKMAMYIGAYGLSVRRILPCVFMVFLSVVCVGVLALQKWEFSIVRFAAGVGAVMLCLLCLSDPDGFAVRYNADRYLSGTLNVFDVEILNRAGPAGVDSALEVYTQTGDEMLKADLKSYLLSQRQETAKQLGHRDNLQKANARQKAAEFAARNP